jgi:hypothetical protein
LTTLLSVAVRVPAAGLQEGPLQAKVAARRLIARDVISGLTTGGLAS